MNPALDTTTTCCSNIQINLQLLIISSTWEGESFVIHFLD
jgi:hypothetical protein